MDLKLLVWTDSILTVDCSGSSRINATVLDASAVHTEVNFWELHRNDGLSTVLLILKPELLVSAATEPSFVSASTIHKSRENINMEYALAVDSPGTTRILAIALDASPVHTEVNIGECGGEDGKVVIFGVVDNDERLIIANSVLQVDHPTARAFGCSNSRSVNAKVTTGELLRFDADTQHVICGGTRRHF